jgi:hypothetical protein
MHHLVLCTEIIDIDGIAGLVHQLAVRVRSGIFDLRGESKQALEKSDSGSSSQWIGRYAQLPLVIRPGEEAVVAGSDGSSVLPLGEGEERVDHS